MLLPEGAREYFADCVRMRGELSAKPTQRSGGIGAVSSDWVAVIANTGEGGV
jgi:hypothetical protein